MPLIPCKTPTDSYRLLIGQNLLPPSSLSEVMTPLSEIAVAIRPAQRSDLDAINAVVEAAVSFWARSKHLSPDTLPDYAYHTIDLDLSILLLVIGSQQHILGVAACSAADGMAAAQGHNALRLDGPYIHPAHHAQGIGDQLMNEARVLAHRQGRDGLLIRPRVPTSSFLHAMGLRTNRPNQQPCKGAKLT